MQPKPAHGEASLIFLGEQIRGIPPSVKLWFDFDTIFVLGRSEAEMQKEAPSSLQIKIVIAHKTISKIHCAIYTNDDFKHVAIDGFRSKPSSNGFKVKRGKKVTKIPDDLRRNYSLENDDILILPGGISYQYQVKKKADTGEEEGTIYD